MPSIVARNSATKVSSSGRQAAYSATGRPEKMRPKSVSTAAHGSRLHDRRSLRSAPGYGDLRRRRGITGQCLRPRTTRDSTKVRMTRPTGRQRQQDAEECSAPCRAARCQRHRRICHRTPPRTDTPPPAATAQVQRVVDPDIRAVGDDLARCLLIQRVALGLHAAGAGGRVAGGPPRHWCTRSASRCHELAVIHISPVLRIDEIGRHPMHYMSGVVCAAGGAGDAGPGVGYDTQVYPTRRRSAWNICAASSV